MGHSQSTDFGDFNWFRERLGHLKFCTQFLILPSEWREFQNPLYTLSSWSFLLNEENSKIFYLCIISVADPSFWMWKVPKSFMFKLSSWSFLMNKGSSKILYSYIVSVPTYWMMWVTKFFKYTLVPDPTFWKRGVPKSFLYTEFLILPSDLREKFHNPLCILPDPTF